MYFMMARFTEVFLPTVNEAFDQTIDVAGTTIEVNVWDTSGAHEFESVRSLVYPDTHAILICYALNNPDSLSQVQELWLPEARRYCPNTPLLLVGLKKDLRQASGSGENDQHMVSTKQAALVAQSINAYKYLECSAKNGEGVDRVFDHAARAALEYTPVKSRKSCIVS